MADIRKILIIFVVAVLFSVLVFSVIEAVYPAPKPEDYCRQNYRPYGSVPAKEFGTACAAFNVSENDASACINKSGYIDYDYDSNGCANGYKCNTCDNDFKTAQDVRNQYVFYISAILALIAIFIGLYLPAQSNSLNEWVGTGFMLGGTFALFFGTAITWSSLDRYIRPLVILIELVLVIFIAYKKIGNLRKEGHRHT